MCGMNVEPRSHWRLQEIGAGVASKASLEAGPTGGSTSSLTTTQSSGKAKVAWTLNQASVKGILALDLETSVDLEGEEPQTLRMT